MAIITYPLNGIEYGAEDVETYLCTRTSGVYAQDGMFAATAIGGRQVQIAPGLAWIKNATYKGKSICVDAPIIVDIAIADTTFARIDRIVLRFDATANASSIAVKAGSPASKPVAPEVSRTESLYELALCDVSVPAGSVTVEPQHLSSKLLDESVCGIMRDAVTGIPTQDLYDAFTAWEEAFKTESESWRSAEQQDFSGWRNTQETAFDEWQVGEKQAYQEWLDGIEQILDESTAGNLLNMINATNEVVATKADRGKAFTATLLTGAWVQSGAVYTQTVSVEGLQANICSIVSMPSSADEEVAKIIVSCNLWCEACTEGQAAFRATKVPTSDITVQIVQSDVDSAAVVNVWPSGEGEIEYITEEITTSRTWTVPDGVSELEVTCIGGGGSGTAGGGGGGGYLARATVIVTQTSYQVVIGAGGSSSSGGQTQFGSIIIAEGGEPSTSETTGSTKPNKPGRGGSGGTGGGAGGSGRCNGSGQYGGAGGIATDKGGANGQGTDTAKGGKGAYSNWYSGGYHTSAGGGGGAGINGGDGGDAYDNYGGGGGGYGTAKLSGDGSSGGKGGLGYGAGGGGGGGNGAPGICIIRYRKF